MSGASSLITVTTRFHVKALQKSIDGRMSELIVTNRALGKVEGIVAEQGAAGNGNGDHASIADAVSEGNTGDLKS